MLRLSKMTDYGTLVLAQMSRRPGAVHTAAELSEATQVGANGGYALARSPEDITAADIIDAIEGHVGITECATDHSNCELEANCNVGTAWQRINVAIRDALRDVSLTELAQPSQLRAPEVRLTGSLKNIPIKVE